MCLHSCMTSSLFCWVIFLTLKLLSYVPLGVFTNIANVLQQDVNDEEFIIVICQSGTIFTSARENSDKIHLGVSPLCSFFAKQMGHMNMNVASSHQKHSSIQEASTESTQDGGVPEDSQVVEASTESTQDGGVPEDSQVVEASTESTQDGGVLESRDEELPVGEASTESTQDGGVPESWDEIHKWLRHPLSPHRMLVFLRVGMRNCQSLRHPLNQHRMLVFLRNRKSLRHPLN